MVRYDKSTAQQGAQYVEDRRGQGGSRRRTSGGGGKAIGGVGGLLIVIVGAIFGLDLTGGGTGFAVEETSQLEGAGAVAVDGGEVVDPDADTVEFMQFLMFDIQDTWDQYFDQAGLNYQTTNLIIFEDMVQSGCGQATSSVGPFYCPAPGDQQVYIDLAFYNELSRRFGAPGDFAQAYVVAHEVAHHVQSITGISDAVRQAQANDPGNSNAFAIRLELQADCLAGVWAFSASQRLTRDTGRPIIEDGDIVEGLQAAASVGDDRIQAQAGMQIDTHTWTHGSSAQRMAWFSEGYDNGDPELCDPFERDVNL